MTDRIVIVIVSFNQIAVTRACLESLRCVTFEQFEVLVVDNGSTDGSADRLPDEYPKMHFIALGTNTGFTGGNNCGIAWCQERGYRAILLLNNDTVVEPEFLTKMAAHLERERLVVPQIRSFAQPEVFIGHMGAFDWRRGVIQDKYYGGPAALASPMGSQLFDMASASCLLVPRRAFEVVGVFDDNFFLYFEDVDFIARAARAGFQLIYEPEAIIYHRESVSSGGERMSPLTLYYNTRNRIYFMTKHRAAGLGFLAYFFMTRSAYTVSYLVQGRFDLLRAMWQGVRDFYAGRLGRNDAIGRSRPR